MLANKTEQVKDAYRARTLHYINYLKVPSKIHERQLGASGVVGVLEFRPDGDASFFRYVTNGMSEVWQTRPDKGIVFTELIFYTATAAKWAIDFLARLAQRTGKSKATVSRVFAGKIERSPEVKEAIEQELIRMEEEETHVVGR